MAASTALLPPAPIAETGRIEEVPAVLETPPSLPLETAAPSPNLTVSIVPGYRPGVLARTLQMHMDYYYPAVSWGREFEAALSKGMGDLLSRLDRPVNQVWTAIMSASAGPSPQDSPSEHIVGVVYVDGECTGIEGVARLRCLIVDVQARGLGVGGKLVRAAMEFVRASGFRECRLATMRELTAARKLYERAGFREAGETWFEGYGKGVQELRYVWHAQDEVPDRDQ